jgi:hypothetical protein
MNQLSTNFFELMNSLKWFGLRRLYWDAHRFLSSSKKILLMFYFEFVYEKSILSSFVSKYIIENFEGDPGQNVNDSKTFLGFGQIHYDLVRNIKPKKILCVGSRKGFIPSILALACKDNAYGYVDFVDAGCDESEPDKHWSGIGFWKKIDAKTHFNKIGVGQFIRTYVTTTQKFNDLCISKATKYDYIYIDGDHSYEGAKLDYQLFWPRLNKNGLFIFHDVVAKGYLGKGRFGVHRLWKEIGGDVKGITFPFPKDSGLGILQKK